MSLKGRRTWHSSKLASKQKKYRLSLVVETGPLFEDSGRAKRLELEALPIAIQRAIVSRETSCYCIDRNRVVKFLWPPDKRIADAEHLKRVKEVKGVARLVGYRCITSIAQLRTGLTLYKKRKIFGYPGNASTSFSNTRSCFQSVGLDEVRSTRKLVENGEGRPAK